MMINSLSTVKSGTTVFPAWKKQLMRLYHTLFLPVRQEILSTCWSQEAEDRVTFTQLADMLERLPKLNRRLSHPGHFWKTSEYVS